MRGFTEYEQETLRTSSKYRIQTFFINKLRSLAMGKSKSMHFFCHVYSKLNLNFFTSHAAADHYFLCLTVVHSDGDTSPIRL